MSITVTPGSGATVGADVVSSTNYQQIKVVDGTIGSTTPLKVNADGSITASVYGNIGFSGSPSISGAVTIVGNSIPNGSVSGTVGASIVGLPPFILGGSTNASVITVGGAGPANQSVSGTVGASIIGTVPVVQSGAWTASIVGGPITLYAPSASLVSGVTSVFATTASVTVLVGAPGGQRNYITNILATNTGTVGTVINIYDAGNVVYAGYAAASGGGFSATLPAPLRQASAQGALCAAMSTTSSVIVAVSGYTAT